MYRQDLAQLTRKEWSDSTYHSITQGDSTYNEDDDIENSGPAQWRQNEGAGCWGGATLERKGLGKGTKRLATGYPTILRGLP